MDTSVMEAHITKVELQVEGKKVFTTAIEPEEAVRLVTAVSEIQNDRPGTAICKNLNKNYSSFKFKMNYMKTIKRFLLLVVITVVSLCSNAQKSTAYSSGVYRTADDFVQHALTYAFDSDNKKDRIHLNELLGGSKGYVVSNGQKHVFSKNEVYGYRDSKKRDYRFYKNEAYRIIDTAGFYLYYKYEQEEHTKGKELVKTDKYFFSKSAGDPIELLTISNLKKAFAVNNKFHYSMDELFRSDKELIAYDYYLNSYKLKYLYYQSLK